MAKKITPINVVMVAVIALMAIDHDGTRYEEGDEFDLPADAVKPLADVNAVKIVNKTEGESAPAANASAPAPAANAPAPATAANAPAPATAASAPAPNA